MCINLHSTFFLAFTYYPYNWCSNKYKHHTIFITKYHMNPRILHLTKKKLYRGNGFRAIKTCVDKKYTVLKKRKPFVGVATNCP